MSSKRKSIINRILGNKQKIKDVPNIEKAEEKIPDSNKADEKIEAPEAFKEYLSGFSREEIVNMLYITRVELNETKRELELSTFRNVQNEMEKENRD